MSLCTWSWRWPAGLGVGRSNEAANTAPSPADHPAGWVYPQGLFPRPMEVLPRQGQTDRVGAALRCKTPLGSLGCSLPVSGGPGGVEGPGLGTVGLSSGPGCFQGIINHLASEGESAGVAKAESMGRWEIGNDVLKPWSQNTGWGLSPWQLDSSRGAAWGPPGVGGRPGLQARTSRAQWPVDRAVCSASICLFAGSPGCASGRPGWSCA